MVAVRGILFDTGDTLTRPVGGRWNPRFDFEDVLLRHHPDVAVDRFAAAFEAGQTFLDSVTGTAARDQYHRIMLRDLGISDPSPVLLEELDRRLTVPVIEPFPDVVAVLDELQARGIRMAIVTDNWGTAETVKSLHDQIGLDGYFCAIAVSEEIGCSKPDPRIFEVARAALDLVPAECLFVDDDPELVAGAIHLGYSGVAICRTGTNRLVTVPSIKGLGELLGFI